MSLKHYVVALAGALAIPAAVAGSVDGPYLVWMNLAQQPGPVDARIRNYVNSGKSECWNSQALLFMRSKPKAITPALVAKALLKQDRKAIAQLNQILGTGFGDEATAGFDGIVVYTDQPSPRLISLTTGKRKVDSMLVESLTKKDELELSFCVVRPDTVRQP